MVREPASEPSTRGLPQPATLFFAATFALLVIAGRRQMFNDPGTFWHLLTGERILTRGLPRQDWLTFTFEGQPWIAHQWLSDCAMALLHRLGGFYGVLVAVSCWLSLVFSWLFRRLIERGVQVRWAVFLTTVAVMTSAGSLHARPLVLSMGFFAWIIASLDAVESGRTGLSALGWTIPLLIVWVNCHGAVLGGLASLWLAGSWWLLRWRCGSTSPVHHRREAGWLLLILLGAALTPLVNPYGLEMVKTWLAIVRSPVIAETIVEHGSVWRTGTWYVLVLAAIYALLFLSAGAVRWRATSLLPLVWLVLMLQRVRHAPLFAMAALVALPGLLTASGAVEWLRRKGVEVCGAAPRESRMNRLKWVAPLAVLGLALVLHRAGIGSLAGPDGGRWPYALRGRIESAAHGLGSGAPVLNDMALGGFLSYVVPGVRIFGDDRCELYGDEFLRAWYEGRPVFFAAWVGRFDVRLALAEDGSPLNDYLRSAPGWLEVGRHPRAILYVRDSAPAGR